MEYTTGYSYVQVVFIHSLHDLTALSSKSGVPSLSEMAAQVIIAFATEELLQQMDQADSHRW